MWQSITGNRSVSDSEDTIRLTSSPNASASRRSLSASVLASAGGDSRVPASSSAPRLRRPFRRGGSLVDLEKKGIEST